MQVVNPQLISGKKILLRLDIDVLFENGQVAEDFRLRAGLPTIHLCLEHAEQVIIMGHIGRPEGKVVKELSVAPIKDWLISQNLSSYLTSGKLKLLENLRFDPREEAGEISFAKELVSMGEVFVNEAFASYRPAVSTTVLPALLPHFAGLRFAEEVKVLTGVRDNPKKPFIAIMGGAKVKDKLPVIEVLAKKADAVLIGGKLIHEIKEQGLKLPKNVMVGMLSEDGFDIAPQTTEAWGELISKAAEIVWNGPVGKFEDSKNDQTKKVAEMILDTSAEIVIGGGDSVAALSQYGLLQKAEEKAFVSVGGGAMLKLLSDGILPTIEALR
ncbi:phosphoglycerate kinase [Patescibacteria group bacterium]|nr:phosphoglycerate kinase [Patescibacteria group bacterium]